MVTPEHDDPDQADDGGHDTPTPPALEVARSLVNYLFHSGEVTLGSRIPPERQLAEAFGVGRSAIREALKSLSLLGLVKIRRGDGTYLVSDSLELLPQVMEWGLLLGPQGIQDALEARQSVAATIAQLAAERCDGRARSRLVLALQAIDPSQEPETFAANELSLHRELATSANNAVLANMELGLQSLLNVWLNRSYEASEQGRHQSQAELTTIVEAVGANNPALAVEAMTAHLAASAARLAAAQGR